MSIDHDSAIRGLATARAHPIRRVNKATVVLRTETKTAPLKYKECVGSYDDCSVYLVSGAEVRQSVPSFDGSGNGVTEAGIPEKEIWVERAVLPDDTGFTLVNSLIEYTRAVYHDKAYPVAECSSDAATACLRAALATYAAVPVKEDVDAEATEKLRAQELAMWQDALRNFREGYAIGELQEAKARLAVAVGDSEKSLYHHNEASPAHAFLAKHGYKPKEIAQIHAAAHDVLMKHFKPREGMHSGRASMAVHHYLNTAEPSSDPNSHILRAALPLRKGASRPSVDAITSSLAARGKMHTMLPASYRASDDIRAGISRSEHVLVASGRLKGNSHVSAPEKKPADVAAPAAGAPVLSSPSSDTPAVHTADHADPPLHPAPAGHAEPAAQTPLHLDPGASLPPTTPVPQKVRGPDHGVTKHLEDQGVVIAHEHAAILSHAATALHAMPGSPLASLSPEGRDTVIKKALAQHPSKDDRHAFTGVGLKRGESAATPGQVMSDLGKSISSRPHEIGDWLLNHAEDVSSKLSHSDQTALSNAADHREAQASSRRAKEDAENEKAAALSLATEKGASYGAKMRALHLHGIDVTKLKHPSPQHANIANNVARGYAEAPSAAPATVSAPIKPVAPPKPEDRLKAVSAALAKMKASNAPDALKSRALAVHKAYLNRITRKARLGEDANGIGGDVYSADSSVTFRSTLVDPSGTTDSGGGTPNDRVAQLRAAIAKKKSQMATGIIPPAAVNYSGGQDNRPPEISTSNPAPSLQFGADLR